MRLTSILVAASLIAVSGAASAGTFSYGQINSPVAEGVVAPNSPRYLPNGEVSVRPAWRANGGVGAEEVPFDNAQTRSGGPSGGNVTQTGG